MVSSKSHSGPMVGWMESVVAYTCTRKRQGSYISCRSVRKVWCVDAWASLQQTRTYTSAGPLVRIGPGFLITDDVDILRQLWSVRSQWQRGPFYRVLRPDPSKDTIITYLDDDSHSAMRSKLAVGVSVSPARIELCELTEASTLAKITLQLNQPSTSKLLIWWILSSANTSQTRGTSSRWTLHGRHSTSRWMSSHRWHSNDHSGS